MRLVDADAVKKTIDKEIFRHDTIDHVFQIIDNAPTIDAVEVVHGEWIWHEDEDICNCSECKFEIDATGCIEPMEYVGVFRYCPNCGAKMDGERKESE